VQRFHEDCIVFFLFCDQTLPNLRNFLWLTRISPIRLSPIEKSSNNFYHLLKKSINVGYEWEWSMSEYTSILSINIHVTLINGIRLSRIGERPVSILAKVHWTFANDESPIDESLTGEIRESIFLWWFIIYSSRVGHNKKNWRKVTYKFHQDRVFSMLKL